MDDPSPTLTEFDMKSLILQQPFDGFRESLRITWGHEQTLLLLFDQVRHPSAACADDRLRKRHRFKENEPEPFARDWQGEDIRVGLACRQLFARKAVEEVDAVKSGSGLASRL